MGDAADIRLVDDERSINAMVDSLAGSPRLGLDTEFHAEHRYRPSLMLVQIAAPDGRVWVVDARACNVRPLGTLLERVPVVVHGGAQDVEILFRATGVLPIQLLDTQRAAALLGQGFPARLGAVVQQTLGRKLDKSAGMTDWSMRPLSSRQLEYAAVDARVLLPLASALEESLRARGRHDWWLAASQEVVDEVRNGPADTDVWMGWDIASQLDDDERRAMSALFAWRELTGRELDQPPRQVISDAIALDLARRRPTTLGELTENRRIPQGLIRRYGAAIIAELRRVALAAPPAPAPPQPEQVLVAQLLEIWAATEERRTGIARSLALPRALSTRIVMEGPQVLEGWRAEAFGEPLKRLLRGELAVKISNHSEIDITTL